MSGLDWSVLGLTLGFIVFYGIWKSRHTKNVQSYLLADKKMKWYNVGLSVMATQASAITFLSGPGQGFEDGMRFVQMYLGLPLAMVVLCVTFVPIFQKLNVFTAYEYLEKRFDNKTRTLTAALFLLQRGLSTGITIYAPAIILSTILGLPLYITILINGVFVITYTVYGGSKAVAHTQTFQMFIIFGGLFVAAYMVMYYLPENLGLTKALHIAGDFGKTNAIDLNFDWNNKYNVWSGIIGGFFLQLSYFGTDQSQVGRYLTGSSINQSRMGLVMNGLVKIPMQFFILGLGALVFVYYQFHPHPLYFNQAEVSKIKNSQYARTYEGMEREFDELNRKKAVLITEKVNSVDGIEMDQKLRSLDRRTRELKLKAREMVKKINPDADDNDSNYVFLTFVTGTLPKGIVGLLVAVIFLASMGSTASGLNSLASSTSVDFYKRLFKKDADEKEYLRASRWATLAWSVFCILVALYASRLGNLIETVNVLGSFFYGTILGIFLVAFYMKRVEGSEVFYAALISEVFVVLSWYFNLTSFLWLNVIGCLMVVVIALVMHLLFKKPTLAN